MFPEKPNPDKLLGAEFNPGDVVEFATDSVEKVTYLTGSRATLRIGFQETQTPRDEVTFQWKRDDLTIPDNARFHMSETKNSIQLAIDHVQKEDAGLYTLYARSKNGDLAVKDVELIVEDRSSGDDPPIFVKRLSDISVKVGTRTRLLVEIRSSTDVKVTWYRNDRRICENDRIRAVHEGTYFCLEIGPVTFDDGGQWMCMAENYGGRNSCLCHLNVLIPKAYKSPEFIEELRAVLTEQGTVSLECKVVGVPTPVLRWFKDSKEIKAGDVFALTANPDDPTSLGTYTCEAVNCMGRSYSSSKVHVVGKGSREGSLKPADQAHVGPPPIFTTELVGKKLRIGETFTLACQVVVPPWPKSVTWYNKEGRVESNDRYKLVEDGLGSYQIEVRPSESCDEGEWKCVVTSSEGCVGISSATVDMDIPKNYRKPRFMETLKAVLTEEGLVSFECKVVGFPTPVLKWFKDGQELKPGDVYQLTGANSLGTYCCVASNCMGEMSSTAVLTIEDIQSQLNDEELQLFSQKNQPPKFIQGLKSQEAKINEEFKFTVSVAATPEPRLSWFRDDLPVESGERYLILREAVGVCHLDIKQVEFIDQAEWKCIATNDFGTSVTSCFLKLQIPRHYKKPRFLECLRAVLTDEGAVNLECKVIGVPQPVLKWYKDGVELKPGDIHRIISGQDGTCCLGTYTCEARNCMGVVASSASLLGYDDASRHPALPQPAELQRNISLSTIHEERTSQMYETPGSDITTEDKADVSFSFDGKEVSVSLYQTPDLTEEEALKIVEMYADQISEHITEHNVVELPPLRFVKETSTSGNLLMEAVVIDVSPEYFSAEDDLRTEADMEDICSVNDTLSHTTSRSKVEEESHRDRLTEEFVQQKMLQMEQELGLEPSKPKRKKSDSAGDEYFSLSHSRPSRESSPGNTATDLQTFQSAKSSEKAKSQMREAEVDDQEVPSKKPRKHKSSSSEETSKSRDDQGLRDISGEEGDGLKIFRRDPEPSAVDIKRRFDLLKPLVKSLTIIEKHLAVIDEEVVIQSGLMMSAASADSSLGVIKNVINPLRNTLEILKGYTGDCSLDQLTQVFLPQLKNLQEGLNVIEKCVEMDEQGKTLVQRTSVCIVESSGEQIMNLLGQIASISTELSNRSLANEVNLLVNDMRTGIQMTQDTIKSQTLLQEATALEAAQHITETIAKMQEVPDVVPPFETVSSAELPQEAESLRRICRPVVKIQFALESLEHELAQEENEEKFYAKVSENIIEQLAEPIEELQREMSEIEKLSLVEMDDLQQKVNIAILDIVTPPMYELQKGLEILSQQSPADSHAGMVSVSILESMVPPLQEIQSGLARIGQDIESGAMKRDSPIENLDAQKLIQSLAQSILNFENNIMSLNEKFEDKAKTALIDLKTGMSMILESVVDTPLDKYKMTILENLRKPMDEINYALRHIEVKSTKGSLADLAEPVLLLEEKIKVCEDILILTNHSPDHASVKALSSTKKTIKIVKKSIEGNEARILVKEQEALAARVQQEDIQELSTATLQEVASLTSAKDISRKETIQLLEELQVRVAVIQENILTDSLKEAQSFDKSSVHESLVKPLVDVQRCIAEIKDILVMESVHSISFENFTVLQKLATPINEVIKHLKMVSSEEVVEPLQSMSTQDNLSLLKTVAHPLQELQNCIAVLREELIVVEQARSMASLEPLTIAKPIQELGHCVATLLANVIEPSEDLSTLEDISALKTIAEDVPGIRDDAAIVQEPGLSSEISDEIPTLSLDDKKVFADQLLTDLEQNLATVKQHCVFEEAQSFSEKSPSLMEALAKPIEEVEKHLATIKLQLTHEVIGKECPIEVIPGLQNLAVPLQKLEQSIEAIQQEILSETSESISEKQEVPQTLSIVQPLEDLKASVAVVEHLIADQDVSTCKVEITPETIRNLTNSIAMIKEEEITTLLSQAKGTNAKEVLNSIQKLVGTVSQIASKPNFEEITQNPTIENLSIIKDIPKIMEEIQETKLPQEVLSKSQSLSALMLSIESINVQNLQNVLEMKTSDDVQVIKSLLESLRDLARAKEEQEIPQDFNVHIENLVNSSESLINLEAVQTLPELQKTVLMVKEKASSLVLDKANVEEINVLTSMIQELEVEVYSSKKTILKENKEIKSIEFEIMNKMLTSTDQVKKDLRNIKKFKGELSEKPAENCSKNIKNCLESVERICKTSTLDTVQKLCLSELEPSLIQLLTSMEPFQGGKIQDHLVETQLTAMKDKILDSQACVVLFEATLLANIQRNQAKNIENLVEPIEKLKISIEGVQQELMEPQVVSEKLSSKFVNLESSVDALLLSLGKIESNLMPETDVHKILCPLQTVHAVLNEVREKISSQPKSQNLEEVTMLTKKIEQCERHLLSKKSVQILPEDLKELYKLAPSLNDVRKTMVEVIDGSVELPIEVKNSLVKLSQPINELEKNIDLVEVHEVTDATTASTSILAPVQKSKDAIKLDAISVSDAHLATAEIDQGLNVREQKEMSLGGEKSQPEVIPPPGSQDDPEKLTAEAKDLLRKSEERELTPIELDSLKYLLSRINSLGVEIHETMVDAKIINQNTAEIIEKIKTEAQHHDDTVKKNDVADQFTGDISASTTTEPMIVDAVDRTHSLKIEGDTSIGDSETIVKFGVSVEVDEFKNVDVNLAPREKDMEQQDIPANLPPLADDVKMEVDEPELVIQGVAQREKQEMQTTEITEEFQDVLQQARKISIGKLHEEEGEKSLEATIEDVSMLDVSQMTSEEQESDIFSDRSLSLDLQQEDIKETSVFSLQEVVSQISAKEPSREETIQLWEELQVRVAVIQENILTDSLTEVQSFDKSSVHESLVKPLVDVQRCIAEIKDILVMESVQSISSENFTVLQKLATPINEVIKHLKMVSSEEVVEPLQSMSTQDNLSLLKTVAHPLQELQNCIAVLREELIVVEQARSMASLEPLTIAKPIQELGHCVATLLANVIEPSEDLSTLEDISALKTIAEDVPGIRDDAAIVQEPGLSSEISDEIPTLSLDDKKVFADQLLTDLEQNLATVKQHCVFEEAQSFSEKSPSLMEALAKPIEEVEKHLATIKLQLTHEVIGKECPIEVIPGLQNLAVPLQKLEQSIEAIQQEILSETSESISAKQEVPQILSIVQPLEDLKASVAVVEHYIVDQETYELRHIVPIPQNFSNHLSKLSDSVRDLQNKKIPDPVNLVQDILDIVTFDIKHLTELHVDNEISFEQLDYIDKVSNDLENFEAALSITRICLLTQQGEDIENVEDILSSISSVKKDLRSVLKSRKEFCEKPAENCSKNIKNCLESVERICKTSTLDTVQKLCLSELEPSLIQLLTSMEPFQGGKIQDHLEETQLTAMKDKILDSQTCVVLFEATLLANIQRNQAKNIENLVEPIEQLKISIEEVQQELMGEHLEVTKDFSKIYEQVSELDKSVQKIMTSLMKIECDLLPESDVQKLVNPIETVHVALKKLQNEITSDSKNIVEENIILLANKLITSESQLLKKTSKNISLEDLQHIHRIKSSLNELNQELEMEIKISQANFEKKIILDETQTNIKKLEQTINDVTIASLMRVVDEESNTPEKAVVLSKTEYEELEKCQNATIEEISKTEKAVKISKKKSEEFEQPQDATVDEMSKPEKAIQLTAIKSEDLKKPQDATIEEINETEKTIQLFEIKSEDLETPQDATVGDMSKPEKAFQLTKIKSEDLEQPQDATIEEFNKTEKAIQLFEIKSEDLETPQDATVGDMSKPEKAIQLTEVKSDDLEKPQDATIEEFNKTEKAIQLSKRNQRNSSNQGCNSWRYEYA
ncbi:muscle M-line assembly protein unc-89 [Sergentomyia squamirostris]